MIIAVASSVLPNDYTYLETALVTCRPTDFNRQHVNVNQELGCTMTNVMQKFLIYLSIYFCFKCFRLFISPSSEVGVALTPYPGDLNHCRICTPASEDGLKESPKHVRQK
jgi:hypothetical protein